jgi:hypothetical protein
MVAAAAAKEEVNQDQNTKKGKKTFGEYCLKSVLYEFFDRTSFHLHQTRD